jgi:hypothetical protein
MVLQTKNSPGDRPGSWSNSVLKDALVISYGSHPLPTLSSPANDQEAKKVPWTSTSKLENPEMVSLCKILSSHQPLTHLCGVITPHIDQNAGRR